jgi:hypothetical protein
MRIVNVVFGARVPRTSQYSGSGALAATAVADTITPSPTV